MFIDLIIIIIILFMKSLFPPQIYERFWPSLTKEDHHLGVTVKVASSDNSARIITRKFNVYDSKVLYCIF